MQSALDPRGPQAARLFELSMVLFIGGTVIFVLVLVFLTLALFAGRREQGGRPREGRALPVVVAATAASTITILALLFYNFSVDRAIASAPQDALVIEVVGHQWWWEVTYRDGDGNVVARTANELHVPVGKPVALELLSRDVIHSFWVPHLHGKTDMIPGRKNHLSFQADQEGVYRGQCAEFCGLQHAKMAFHVVAEPEERFAEWLEHQARPALQAADPLAERGERVFLEGPCVLCHAVRGTKAMGSAGPDLTHLAGRLSLAAGTLPNTRGNLGGFISDPQHIKPGVRMPDSRFDASSFEALLHYLQTLK